MYTHTFIHTTHLPHLPWPMHITHAQTKYLQPRRTHELAQQVETDAHPQLMVDDFVILEYLVRWLIRRRSFDGWYICMCCKDSQMVSYLPKGYAGVLTQKSERESPS